MARKPRGTKVTKQQDKFAREYALNGNNGAEAYRVAYPKSKNKSSKYRTNEAMKLMKNQAISQAIAEYAELVTEVAQEKADEFKVDAERVLRELALIAFQDPRKIMRWGSVELPMFTKKGEPIINPQTGQQAVENVPFLDFKDSDSLSDEEAAVVSSAEKTTSKTGDIVVNIKRADKVAALKLLGTHLKLFTTKVEHSGEVKSGPVNLIVSTAEAEA